MKKFSNITILILSIGFASAPVSARQTADPTNYIGYTHGAYSIGLASTSVLARQAVDPTDYVGYTHGAYIISLASAPSIGVASVPAPARQAVDPTDYIGYTHGVGTSVELARSSHSADDRESRLIGKLLWKNDHVQGDHGNVK